MKEFLICDTHNDFLTELAPSEFATYAKRCKRSGVESICASYWSTQRRAKHIEAELAERAGILREKTNFLLHIEDLWWVENEEGLKNLLRHKPFSCSLTWNDKNALASGSAAVGGLSEWGKACVKALMDAGVVVDVAHLNRQSFFEVAKLVGKNVYCSHAGFYGVRRHKRNLTDKQIDMIVKSNGFVGLFFFDKCLKKRTKGDETTFGVADIVESLCYFTSRWGFDNIGIGTDFFGIENPPERLADYADFHNLADALFLRGFSLQQVNKIFCENFWAFVKRINLEKA